MDGLLIDSEDIYTKCNNEILHEHGKPSLPWSIKAQLQGRPGPEVRSQPTLRAMPALTPSRTGRRNLPCLGSASHNPIRIPVKTISPPKGALPICTTSPRRPRSPRQPSGPTYPHRLGHLLPCRELRPQELASQLSLFVLHTPSPCLG